jgi:hypothetical protein
MQRVPYLESTLRIWSFQNRRTRNSHCEISRRICAAGSGITMLQGMIERRNWKILWNGNDFGKKLR